MDVVEEEYRTMKIENHKLRLQDIIRKAMMAWDMELSDFLDNL